MQGGTVIASKVGGQTLPGVWCSKKTWHLKSPFLSCRISKDAPSLGDASDLYRNGFFCC